MKNKGKMALGAILALFLVATLISNVSAVVVTSVNAPRLTPGQQATLDIRLENILSEDVQDITINLNFQGLPITPIDGSSAGFDELNSDEDARASFVVRAASDATPGDYQIPYTITYNQNGDDKTRNGSIGITISSQPSLSYTISTENPVIGQEGKVTLKIVNTGFADAKFVSVRALPIGFTILSEDQIYIGNVDSDDFETATFDVVFSSNNPSFSAIIDYTDFDNKKITKTIDIPVVVYTKERAIELGIIEKNNLPVYIGIVVLVIVLWIIWRAIKRRQRLKRSERG